MSILKKLAGQTALYGLSSMIGRAINFLLVPVYTSLLLPAEYGIVTELYTYAAFLNILYLFGMETTYFRFANKEAANESHIFNHVNTQVLLGSGLISLLILFFASDIAAYLNIGNSVNRTTDYIYYIYYIVFILFTDAALSIAFARLRLRNKAFWFASVKLMNIFLTVFFNVVLLWGIPMLLKSSYISEEIKTGILKWYDPNDLVSYIFISNLLANVLQLPFLLKAFEGIAFVWDTYLYKPMLVYALPLMVMGLTGMVNEMLDRLILRELLPDNFYPGKDKLHALGVYGACYKLSMFMTLAIQAFRYAAEPFFFSRASDKNSPQLFADIMKWFVVACLLIFLGVSLNIDLFKHFLGNSTYWEGLAVVPILLLANLFLGIYYNLAVWFKLTDKTYWGLYISFFGAAITIAGNIIFIPVFGYVGAAWVTLACYFSVAAASYLLGHKYYPIPYPIVKILCWIGSAYLMVSLSEYVQTTSVWCNALISNGAILIWLAWILLLENPNIRTKAS